MKLTVSAVILVVGVVLIVVMIVTVLLLLMIYATEVVVVGPAAVQKQKLSAIKKIKKPNLASLLCNLNNVP